MRRIRVIFETDGKKVGYIIDPEGQKVTSGVFDDAARQIVEVSQEGLIKNAEEVCKQIYYVLLAGTKNS